MGANPTLLLKSSLLPTEELIASDETYEVEFKSTARWNLRDGCKD